MKPKKIFFLFSILFCLLICENEVFSQISTTSEIYVEPIYKVNYEDATADKPQSKSWSTKNGYWVVVGDSDGPKLLRKTAQGWSNQSAVNQAWKYLPSRADVLRKGSKVYILLVDECILNVVEIKYSKQHQQYEHQWKANLLIPDNCNSIETATITQDSKNEFWVCADMNEKIMVWHSINGKDWSNPFELAGDINKDDIALIVGFKNQISAIWSNQNTESIIERIHIDGDAPNKWSAPIIVQAGDKNADDHLNATVFKNGTIAMVTKNSVDKIGKPQFVLRIRDTIGKWTNIPYQNLMPHESPSRPIINHVESGRIFEIHSVKNKENSLYYISVNEIMKKKDNWEFTELVQLKTKIKGKNGDATSSKANFLKHEAKLIFFSDDLGNIYSFDLDSL